MGILVMGIRAKLPAAAGKPGNAAHGRQRIQDGVGVGRQCRKAYRQHIRAGAVDGLQPVGR